MTSALPDQMLVAAFMANIPDHVYFKDRDSRFISVSLSLAQSVGCTVAEMIGKTDNDFFNAEQAAIYRERELRIMATGEAMVDKEIKHTWADGRTTWALNVAMPMRAPDGTIVGVFGTNKDITAAKLTEQALAKAHQELLDMSRLAGMADAATGVVHNVGNVLNGVNVSTHVLGEGIRKLQVKRLGLLCDLLREHSADLGAFMNTDPRGKSILPFLDALHSDLSASQAQMLDEVASLENCVGHIKEIISIQQSYATIKGLTEELPMDGIVEDAIKISRSSFMRHGVKIITRYDTTPKISGERGKILQILNNLFRNAKHALDESDAAEKIIEVTIGASSQQDAAAPATVRVVITDNGVGIPAENLTRIFSQGFTTRRGGHGFGLHMSANAAKQMHGSLTASSPGVGAGASFTLELPGAR